MHCPLTQSTSLTTMIKYQQRKDKLKTIWHVNYWWKHSNKYSVCLELLQIKYSEVWEGVLNGAKSCWRTVGGALRFDSVLDKEDVRIGEWCNIWHRVIDHERVNTMLFIHNKRHVLSD